MGNKQTQQYTKEVTADFDEDSEHHLNFHPNGKNVGGGGGSNDNKQFNQQKPCDREQFLANRGNAEKAEKTNKYLVIIEEQNKIINASTKIMQQNVSVLQQQEELIKSFKKKEGNLLKLIQELQQFSESSDCDDVAGEDEKEEEEDGLIRNQVEGETLMGFADNNVSFNMHIPFNMFSEGDGYMNSDDVIDTAGDGFQETAMISPTEQTNLNEDGGILINTEEIEFNYDDDDEKNGELQISPTLMDPVCIIMCNDDDDDHIITDDYGLSHNNENKTVTSLKDHYEDIQDDITFLTQLMSGNMNHLPLNEWKSTQMISQFAAYIGNNGLLAMKAGDNATNKLTLQQETMIQCFIVNNIDSSCFQYPLNERPLQFIRLLKEDCNNNMKGAHTQSRFDNVHTMSRNDKQCVSINFNANKLDIMHMASLSNKEIANVSEFISDSKVTMNEFKEYNFLKFTDEFGITVRLNIQQTMTGYVCWITNHDSFIVNKANNSEENDELQYSSDNSCLVCLCQKMTIGHNMIKRVGSQHRITNHDEKRPNDHCQDNNPNDSVANINGPESRDDDDDDDDDDDQRMAASNQKSTNTDESLHEIPKKSSNLKTVTPLKEPIHTTSKNNGILSTQRMNSSFISKTQRPNVYISKLITTQYRERIQETFKDPKSLFRYLTDTIMLQTNDGFAKIYDNQLMIINLDLHNQTSGNRLFAIIQRNNDKLIKTKFEWNMVEFSEPEAISYYYNVSPYDLPLSSRKNLLFQLNQEEKVKNLLKNKMQQIVYQTKWNKFNKISNNERLKDKSNKHVTKTLRFTKPQFIKKLIEFMSNKSNDKHNKHNIIPILIFDDEGHHIEYVQIVNICDTSIGISYVYNQQKNTVEATGIHLNKQFIQQQHQLISPHHECECLNDFVSNVDYLEIGDSNKLQNQKVQYEKLFKELGQSFKNLVKCLTKMVSNIANMTTENMEKLIDIANKVMMNEKNADTFFHFLSSLYSVNDCPYNTMLRQSPLYIRQLEEINNFYFIQTANPMKQPIIPHPIHIINATTNIH